MHNDRLYIYTHTHMLLMIRLLNYWNFSGWICIIFGCIVRTPPLGRTGGNHNVPSVPVLAYYWTIISCNSWRYTGKKMIQTRIWQIRGEKIRFVLSDYRATITYIYILDEINYLSISGWGSRLQLNVPNYFEEYYEGKIIYKALCT